MKYELINPSDKIFFYAPSLLIASLSVFLLSTKYGAKSQESDDEVPIFIFGGAEQWLKDKFEISDIKKTFEENFNQIIDCLNTFKVDGRRSSINDICKYAKELADVLRTKEVKE